MGSDILNNVAAAKYLGLMINNKGNMDDHIKMVYSKILITTKSIIKILCNDKIYKNSAKIAVNMVASIINPILSYAWEACIYTAKELNKLVQMQISTIKNIFGLKKFTSNWGVLTELGLALIYFLIDERRTNFIMEMLFGNEITKNVFLSNRY